MDLAKRWTAAPTSRSNQDRTTHSPVLRRTRRQLFGLSYYKAGQLQAPCSAFEEDPEPRPTNPRATPLSPYLNGYGLDFWVSARETERLMIYLQKSNLT
jgi:hypothetical protein